MKNFLKSIADKLNICESKLINNYNDLENNPKFIIDLYKNNSKNYVKCILFLIRIPFKDQSFFYDGLRDKYLDALLILVDLDEYLVLEILENTLYWRDIYSLWVKINNLSLSKKVKIEKYDKFIRNIRTLLNNQRANDLTHYRNNEDISLLAKYCPSENSYFDKKAYWYTEGKKESNISFMIRQNMSKIIGYKIHEYPETLSIPFSAKKQWRKENAILKKQLNIIESKLCSKESITDEDIVPKKCAKKNGLSKKKLRDLDIGRYIEENIYG